MFAMLYRHPYSVKSSLDRVYSTPKLAWISAMLLISVRQPSNNNLFPLQIVHLANVNSNRNIRPLIQIPQTRVPQPHRRSGPFPRQQTRHRLGNLGVSSRRDRISGFRGIWQDSSFPVAGSSSAAVWVDTCYYGEYAELVE